LLRDDKVEDTTEQIRDQLSRLILGEPEEVNNSPVSEPPSRLPPCQEGTSGNSMGSLPDILDAGQARISFSDSAEDVRGAGGTTEDSTMPLEVDRKPETRDVQPAAREVADRSRTLEAFAEKIRTLKKSAVPSPTASSAPPPCDACCECGAAAPESSSSVSGANTQIKPRPAPTSRLKQKMLNARRAASSAAAGSTSLAALKKKVAEEKASNPEVRKSEDSSSSDDDRSGEELLKNLKLPPDITITRVKSADGKKSFNFRRNNASLEPSLPSSQKPSCKYFNLNSLLSIVSFFGSMFQFKLNFHHVLSVSDLKSDHRLPNDICPYIKNNSVILIKYIDQSTQINDFFQ
jgi:hypothetical protein